MMHIRISPNTKFQNKLAIFIYWTRFAVEIGKSEHNHSILHLQIERKQQHFPCWGSDALVHLAEPGQKNIPQHLFGAIHLRSTYLMTDAKL